MRIIILTLSLLFVSSFCSCRPPKSPIEELAKVDFVFTGEVESVDYSDSPNNHVFEFSLMRQIKGSLNSSIEIYTGSGNGDCGFRFELGKKYLIYAYLKDDRLVTNACTRTTELDLDGINEALLLSLHK